MIKQLVKTDPQTEPFLLRVFSQVTLMVFEEVIKMPLFKKIHAPHYSWADILLQLRSLSNNQNKNVDILP